MKYQKIIPVITFIIGGCIGIKCGGKLVLYAQKQYLKSDEWEKRKKEVFKNRFKLMLTEIEKES